MSQEIEMEVKVLLNYKSYVRLLRYFQLENSEAIVQTNHYFDTPEFHLSKMKAALRIRQLGTTYTLTLKTSLDSGRLEINENISRHAFDQLMEGGSFRRGDVYAQLEKMNINIKSLRYVNSLVTRRHQFSYVKDDAVIGKFCLDANTYGDYVDYELEFEGETLEIGRRAIAEVMNAIGLPFAFSDLSKIERAFNSTIR